MGQVDFAYEIAADGAGLPLALSLFVANEDTRREWMEDVSSAGYALHDCGDLGAWSGHDARALGDIVLVDCLALQARCAAALSRLDERIAHSGARLVVTTDIESLDAVFGCCLYSRPQILVQPSRAERVMALARALAHRPTMRVREWSSDDRLTLLRLAEQVGDLARRLDGISEEGSESAQSLRFASPGVSWRGQADETLAQRCAKVPLPDPRLVRRVIQQRQARAEFFDGELFADPAWDMLLDLTAARADHTRVSITSLCIASGVPPTTALRWIGQMVEAGLFERVDDDTDRRRAFIQLSDKAADAMARYFVQIGRVAELAA